MNTLNSIIAEPSNSPQPRRRKIFPKGEHGVRLALFAGLLLFLANPPFGLWPLAWVALAPLVVSVSRAGRWRQAVWRGYLFGWLFLGPTWYWTGLTIAGVTQSGGLGLAAWFLLTLILSAYYGLWGGMTWWFMRRLSGGWRIVAPAALWVLLEWLRTIGSVTMPWAQVSYTQVHFLPILQVAELTGAYGVSFLVLLFNAALDCRWIGRSDGSGLQPLLRVFALVLFMIIFGAIRFSIPDSGTPLVVAAMQGNFKSNDARESAAEEYRTFQSLTAEALAGPNKPALFVWGESSSPRDALYDYGAFQFMSTLAGQTRAPVVVGSRVVEVKYGAAGRTDTESNASVMFRPEGGQPARYNKQQLVPFGEFLPLRGLIPSQFDDTFAALAKDVTPGTETTVFRFNDPAAGDVALGPFICYESMYPSYPRAMVRKGADLLVTQSNDDWFQSEAAMEQHLAAVILRAVETRRQIVRSTSTGITCFIDSRGVVYARAPINAMAALKQTVTLKKGQTLYVRLGDWFVLTCAAALIIALRGQRRQPVPGERA